MSCWFCLKLKRQLIMRVTDVRLRLNIGAQFRALWLLKSRRRISDTGAEAILTARGVPVVDPREILSPAYPRIIEVVDPPPQPSVLQDWKTEVKDTPCHVFNKRFSPLIGMPQVQCLTNSVVQSSLPKSVLDCATKITEEEDKKVKEAIFHAHLLDSFQAKLPKVINMDRPGWNERREYGIPFGRKHKTLTYQLLLLLDQQVPGALERQLVEDTLTQVTLKHSDSLMQINHEAAFIVSSLTPLPQLADNAEIKSLQEETLPDIYPLSPLVNCRAFNTYCLKDSYGVASNNLYPHTIFIHQNQSRMKLSEDQFAGISLLHAFSHAAAYAKATGSIVGSNLEKPVVLQVVHMHRQYFHMGVFQLNTLNLTGTTKNIFWTQPWEPLFSKCCFQAAQPVLEGYNPRVFELLKGLHAQC
ncbi:hypothetical protein OTU49_009493 [Cherax quadricarinatus]|uniref:39S ribosomal protein L37, mitochondrial n=1 Tax=Cherax quadricarinatus TaxID=27406 RepID=A0AAW0Y461_CHEQU